MLVGAYLEGDVRQAAILGLIDVELVRRCDRDECTVESDVCYTGLQGAGDVEARARALDGVARA